MNGGDGEIVIENFNSEELTVSGTFKFNAYSINGDIVNFTKGIFNEIPIAGSNDSINIVSNSFSAKVNMNATEFSLIKTNILNNILQIRATDVDGAYLEIFMLENISIGNHTLNFSTQIYANYVGLDRTVAASQFGTLSISEHDQQFKRIKGTFFSIQVILLM